MTAHLLAQLLLKGPDVPVVVNGWGSDEGLGPFEVTSISEPKERSFIAPSDDENISRDKLGYALPRLCISFRYERK